MKTYLLFMMMLLVSIAYSQDKSREEVIQLIADDTCQCIKDDPSLSSPEKSLNQKKMGLGLCLLKSYNVRKKESKAFSDKGMKDFESIGEEVGMLMATTCVDDFMSLFSEDQLVDFIEEDEMESSYEDMPPPPPAPKNEDDLSIEATLVSLNNEAISYIEVVDAYDKKHTLIVSEQFEGYQFLKKSNLKKNFRVFFKEDFYFDLSERRYVKKKVIKYIELLDN